MSVLDNIIFCAFICVVGGIATASQGAVNSKLGQFSGQGLCSTIVFFVGAITSCIYFLIEVKGRPPTDLLSTMGQAPWWAWTGGVIGAVFVIITILAIPKLGAGTTTAIIVCAQLIFSCIIDNFSIFGINYRQYTVWRGIATVGLISCVAAIAKF
ncbi:hypothetical protein BX616_005300 [Lobosporangium transversale]|uniref:DMT family transporter n=1 Tax=Lobosporangium transversale TaxID=64571 RepID=A0A1Y2GNC7_9FUNG|nr:hypothetical protein BCR41DRAFT_422454 [Lobosporangium transversale]KAF9897596.1 hypothetical protein BX616_005300 [Lobosporangium transversale]ORZ14960.1 hypothetical protein BCR41DRAFT_422454 [Lobosporangium transversale]|eukprot:XP_021881092.1 hypothetical protein BCR41DRAFT_422454 [Lobosporangium transversale]